MTAFIARRPANPPAEPRMTPVASKGPALAAREAASTPTVEAFTDGGTQTSTVDAVPKI